MKIHSPEFEKTLGRMVRQTVRNSPALKREKRRVNRFWWKLNVVPYFRPIFGLIAGLIACSAWSITGHLGTGLAVINLLLACSIGFQVNGLLTRLHASSDLNALHLLPVTRETIVRWELQKYFRWSLFALGDVTIAVGALVYATKVPPALWVGAGLIAVLSWLVLLAMALFLAAWRPRWRYSLINSGIFFAFFIIAFSDSIRKLLYGPALTWLDRHALELNLLLPTGWPVSLVQLLAGDLSGWLWGLFLPIAALIATVPSSLRRLTAEFQFEEQVLPEPDNILPPAEARAQSSSTGTEPLTPAALPAIILSRQFLAGPAWRERGWFEQMLWRWFSPREQALAELVFPNGLSIVRRWLAIFRNLLIVAVLAYAAAFAVPSAQPVLLCIGLFVTFIQTYGQFFARGQAFLQVLDCGVNIPLYAGHGIGFRELSQLLFKYSVIQLPWLLGFTVAVSVLMPCLYRLPVDGGYDFGFVFGVKCGLLLAGGRLVQVAMLFSSGSNDTSRWGLRAAVLAVVMMILGLLPAGMAVATMMVPGLLGWVWLLGALVSAYAFFGVYRWFYLSGRFDLMSLPRG